jgi:hypothetical protein
MSTIAEVAALAAGEHHLAVVTDATPGLPTECIQANPTAFL